MTGSQNPSSATSRIRISPACPSGAYGSRMSPEALGLPFRMSPNTYVRDTAKTLPGNTHCCTRFCKCSASARHARQKCEIGDRHWCHGQCGANDPIQTRFSLAFGIAIKYIFPTFCMRARQLSQPPTKSITQAPRPWNSRESNTNSRLTI